MAGKKSRSLSPKKQEKNARASTDTKAKRGPPAKKFAKEQAVIYKGPTAKVKRNSKERNVLSSLSKEIAAEEIKRAAKKEENSEEEASSEEEEERIVDMTENKQEAESEDESPDEKPKKVIKSSKKANIVKKTTKTKLSKKEIMPASSEEEEPEDESNEDEAPKSKKTSKKAQASESDAESGDANEGSDDDDAEGKTKKGKFFSDDNAAWLKPKQSKSQLLSSDDEDEDGAGDDDEMIGGDDDDSDEEMEVERQSRLLDAEMQVEEEEGEEEFRETVAKHTAIYHLPTLEELEGDVDRVVPPSELKSHIESILGVLAEFKNRREEGRARTEYVERLAGFMAELFGYLPELMSYFLTMFSPAEALEFVEYSDKPRPMVVRTNTLKTRRKDLALALMKRGVSLDPLANWSKVGLKIVESPVPVGATPEYLSGHYMLQSAASMCPVLALAPEPKERVLDMSAAPGGKTSYIAQLMRNTGVVFANDLRPDRQKATVANMHRLGVKNVVTCMDDGRKLPQIFKHYKFDRILLDAPCSGLGVISRDPSVKVQRTLADVNKCAHLQKELILAAIDCLNHKSKTGGVMIYSTCSVAVAENEEVVNYALQKRDIKIIETGLDFGKPGFTRYQQKRFHPSVALTRRFYPHVHNMDGFYVCKIQKLSDKRPGQDPDATSTEAVEEVDVDAEEEVQSVKVSDEEEKEVKGKDDDDDDDDEPKKKRFLRGKKGRKRSKSPGKEVQKKKKGKIEKVSVPPTKPKQNTKKQNAKTMKPRRSKPATDV